jgi:hypothetical protein
VDSSCEGACHRQEDEAREHREREREVDGDASNAQWGDETTEETDRRVRCGVHTFGNDKHRATGTPLTVEDGDPLENEPSQQHENVDQDCRVEDSGNDLDDVHVSSLRERNRLRIRLRDGTLTRHRHILGREEEDLARHALDAAVQTERQTAREVDETACVGV